MAGKKSSSDNTQRQSPFRITDYPMHYFAAIQRRNYDNMSRALGVIGISPLEWRVLAILGERRDQTVNEISAPSMN